MLSKESERFLREFRVELMTRGKDDDAIVEMEAELRDHLMEAEAEGKSINDVTNGSVEAYIDSISKEMPFDNKIGRMIGTAALGLLLMLAIPDLLSGTFEFTVSHFIYILLLFILAPLGAAAFLKHLIVEHTDFHNEKIDRMGYVKLVTASVIFMGLLIGGIFLYRTFPIYEFLTLDLETSRLSGYVLLGFAVVLFLILKQWIILAAVLVVSLPQILAQIFTGGSPDDQNYLIIVAVSLLILWFIFSALAFLKFKKDKTEE